jgi:hypothetical protein
MSEFDPMQETNEKFYDIINQDDWNFDFGKEFEIQDAEMEEFTPPVMQYWLPTPIAGVHLRIDFVIEDGRPENDEVLNFLNNLSRFLEENEGEQW